MVHHRKTISAEENKNLEKVTKTVPKEPITRSETHRRPYK